MAGLLPTEIPGVDKAVFAELYRWCREGNTERLRDFLYHESGAHNYFNVRTTKGNTLIHEAVESGQSNVIQLLLQNGISPESKGKNNQSPLHLASVKGHIECLRALLEGGADINFKDDLGHTALDKAERSKRREAILRLLKSKGWWAKREGGRERERKLISNE